MPVNTVTLSASAIPGIAGALFDDAAGLIYSAKVSFADAVRGIAGGYCSWAVVKLYYSSFYSVRALLAANSVVIFYTAAGRPFSLELAAASMPKKEKGPTHKVVWSVLGRALPSSPLHGDIDGVPASEWLTSLRENTNYKTPKFPDPVLPDCLSSADGLGLSRAVKAYAEDTSLLYAFDPDHAVLAFPLECLRRATHALRNAGIVEEPADQAHLAGCLEAIGLVPNLFEDL